MVHRGEDGAEEAGREERLEEGRVVRPQPGHAIPPGDAETAQAVGQAPDPRGQLGVRTGFPPAINAT